MDTSNIYFLVKIQDEKIYKEKFIVEQYNTFEEIDFNQKYFCIIKSIYNGYHLTKYDNKYRCSNFFFIDENEISLITGTLFVADRPWCFFQTV